MKGWIPLAALAALGLASVVALPFAAASQGSEPSLAAKVQIPPGYLPISALPDSMSLLPPPPAAESGAMKGDEEARQAALKLRDGPRFRLAAGDAVIGFPELPNDFACAMGFRISKESTPRLYGLMAKMLVDVGLSTYRAKDHYKRTRPFVVHKTATCFPQDEATLRTDGSYPSGHSAIGWGYALVLAELLPERSAAILQRGREYGQSRLVCDVHWQSDIDAGRIIASATVARLHGEATFTSDLAAAKAEIASGPQRLPDPATCSAESAALALGPGH